MKALMIISVVSISMSLLSGCVLKTETTCGYRKDYYAPYYNCPTCGPRITYRCDYVCDLCHSNEPACRACWMCISREGCGGYYPRS